jgi:hypothetical protein
MKIPMIKNHNRLMETHKIYRKKALHLSIILKKSIRNKKISKSIKYMIKINIQWKSKRNKYNFYKSQGVKIIKHLQSQ